MTITIPDTAIQKAGLTEASIKLEIALTFFQMDILTLAQAANIAGLHRMQFQEELARREIPIHYGVNELEEDLNTLNISF